MAVAEPAQQDDVVCGDGHCRHEAADRSEPLSGELPRGPSDPEKFQHNLHFLLGGNRSVSSFRETGELVGAYGTESGRASSPRGELFDRRARLPD